MVSKSNRMWVLAHADELKSLPDGTFRYDDVDISFSLFRQAAEREIIEKRGEEGGVFIWKLNKSQLNDEIARELEKSAEGGGDEA